VADNPAREANDHSTSYTRKLESLIELYAELDRQSSIGDDIPRKRLSPAEFYKDYFYPNRPVIVEGLMVDWPASTKWTFPWLRANFGDHEIEVHANRSNDPRYEQHFRGNCSTMNFGDFVSLLESPGESNNTYIVGRNLLLARPEFSGMLQDIHNPPGFLDSRTMNDQNVKLWIGPRGTVTPLHHDRGSVLFGQVSGRKHVKFISPFHLPSLYNDPNTCYSDVVLDDTLDLNRYPEMRHVVIMEAVIGPGDFLFIPVGWWHWVRALDASISLTFKNFLFRTRRIAWNYR
jgi:ribosomal protein L16 Arg81 hydroxylase